MGLDMYFTRKKYVGAEYEHRNVKGTIFITINGKELPIDFDKVSYIEEKVGYWRKANAIHKWFVDNVQDGVDDCRYAYVDLDKIEELLKVCKKVKKAAILEDGDIQVGTKFEDGKPVPIMEKGKVIVNGEEVAAILPTNDGFFFGSTDYDEWYMENIDYTIKILTEIVKEEKEMCENGIFNEYYYHSSW